MLRIRQNNQKGFDIAEDGDGLDISYPSSKTRRGRVSHRLSHTLTGGGNECVVKNEKTAYDEQNGYERLDGTVGTLTSDGSSPKHNNRVIEKAEDLEGYRVRKLTPKECWRLMGFADEDFEKAQAVNSNSQLYKQAGNSIVVDVLMAIFRQMTEDAVIEEEQTSLFGSNRFIISKPIRLIELFAGIGSQAKRMKNLGLDFETYRVCEWDKFCISSYNAIHNTSFETSDITKLKGEDLGIVDTDMFEYMVTYSFPCQDLSLAGKKAGMTKGESTRSGLLWEVERLLNETEHLPQILVMENVPQVHSKRNIEDFEKWIKYLEGRGYSNFWQDLNAKDFGVPQNRNRCFMVSLLGDWSYEFPKGFELEKCLADVLEDEVDEKFYLKDFQIERMLTTNFESGKFEHRVTDVGGVTQTLRARDFQDPKCVMEREEEKVLKMSLMAHDAKGGAAVHHRENGSIRVQVSHAVRGGGRNTYDRKHRWDVILTKEESNSDG